MSDPGCLTRLFLERASRIWRGARVAPRQGSILTRLFALVAVSTFSFALWVSAATSQVPPASKRSSSSFDFSYVVRAVPSPHTHNVRVWVPLPSSDELQTISEVRLEAPVRVRMRKEEKYGNHYAYFTVNSSRIQAPFEIRLTFHVVRYERHLDLASAIDASGEPRRALRHTCGRTSWHRLMELSPASHVRKQMGSQALLRRRGVFISTSSQQCTTIKRAVEPALVTLFGHFNGAVAIVPISTPCSLPWPEPQESLRGSRSGSCSRKDMKVL
jgi:hypothetical protein